MVVTPIRYRHRSYKAEIGRFKSSGHFQKENKKSFKKCLTKQRFCDIIQVKLREHRKWARGAVKKLLRGLGFGRYFISQRARCNEGSIPKAGLSWLLRSHWGQVASCSPLLSRNLTKRWMVIDRIDGWTPIPIKQRQRFECVARSNGRP